ncbi:maltokinase N-terminal cap-like domain-containing protein [Zhihengliuella halotolerans]|uniref:Maltokinase N-terminal cap domain-containing protein n=1 Tax=Zhihengliuella halotolerans TaxID=370736 RepID=A0A4Q8ACV7_9MICC|nr:1,4-alpha-glucan branching protein [Zhihengliuella halotolerans]RZU62008.1 hypothetical protein EV380_1594 [Zhihengliuella halotolerans]
MATIHRTTMNPTKLELLEAWLPGQPFYAGAGTPRLEKNAGFRLDDPAGEVGIEFVIVTDVSGPEPVVYHVPQTYRAEPLEGAEAALVGTSEHGVLGTRYIYDGAADPVWRDVVRELFGGTQQPQAQSVPETAEPGVRVAGAGADAQHVEIVRRPVPGDPADHADAGAFVVGFWFAGGTRVTGTLLRAAVA